MVTLQTLRRFFLVTCSLYFVGQAFEVRAQDDDLDELKSIFAGAISDKVDSTSYDLSELDANLGTALEARLDEIAVQFEVDSAAQWTEFIQSYQARTESMGNKASMTQADFHNTVDAWYRACNDGRSQLRDHMLKLVELTAQLQKEALAEATTIAQKKLREMGETSDAVFLVASFNKVSIGIEAQILEEGRVRRNRVDARHNKLGQLLDAQKGHIRFEATTKSRGSSTYGMLVVDDVDQDKK